MAKLKHLTGKRREVFMPGVPGGYFANYQINR
jgi:hypothetical protein